MTFGIPEIELRRGERCNPVPDRSMEATSARGTVLWYITKSLDGFLAPPRRLDCKMRSVTGGLARRVARASTARARSSPAGGRGSRNRAGAGPRAIYGGARLGPASSSRLDRPTTKAAYLSLVEEAVEEAVAIVQTRRQGRRRVRSRHRSAVPSGGPPRRDLRAPRTGVAGWRRPVFDSLDSPPVGLRKARCEDPGQLTDPTFEVLRERQART